MNKNNPKIEGPFEGGGNRYPDYLNKCGSCGEQIGIRGGKEDKEYRRTLNEKNFKKTGGREGRIYYCFPCGEKISIQEGIEANEEQEKINEKLTQEKNITIKNCSATIDSLTQKLAQENVAGTIEDYKKIKSVQQKLKKIGNVEDPIIKEEVEKLKKTCLDLINEYISPKTKNIGDNSKHAIHSPCCTPRNVKLEESDSEQYYYCDYCWETESPYFLKSLKSYHIDKLNKVMLDNGVSATELNSSNYHSMLTIPDFILTQEGIINTYQKAEQDLQVFLEKKGIKIDGDKSNLQIFQSNSIQSVELTDKGDLDIKYDKGGQKTVKNEALSTELQKIVENMKKNNQTKLTKEELEQQLRELEEKKQREQGQNKNKESDGLGLKIGLGIGVGAVVVVVLGVILVRKRKFKNY